MTLKEFRQANKLSQQALADALGISVSSERQYEYGKREPSSAVLERLKAVYGVDLNAPETKKDQVATAPAKEPAKKAHRKKEAEVVTASEEQSAKKTPRKKEAAPAEKPRRARKKTALPTEASVDEGLKSAAEASLFEKKVDIVIQSPMGGEITAEEILAKLPLPVDKVYIRVDQNAAYWVKGDESGAVNLW